MIPEDDTQARMAKVFSQVYETNKWQGNESGSGPGSGLAVTRAVRRSLPAIARAYGVHTLLDAPCGDLHWMKDVDLPIAQYIGVDVVPAVVERLTEEYDAPGRSFLAADITSDDLPKSDLIFCRDCLVHLVEDEVMAAIRQFKASGARLLFTTTFYALTINRPGSTGGWRPINLQLPPFNFPMPELIVPERSFAPGDTYSDKALGLWYVDNLPQDLSS